MRPAIVVGDVSAHRAEVIEQLARVVTAVDVDHPTRVAIDGPDAAGKTTLADELADMLRNRGETVIRASIDGFHRPRSSRYALGPDSPEGYYEDSFDEKLLKRELLDPLGPEGTREYRTAVFDHRTDRRVESPRVRSSDTSILVFDGVFLMRPSLRELWDLRVLVSASFEERLRRALVRDRDLFGAAEEVERRYRVRYQPGQEIYVREANPEEVADVIVENDDPRAPTLRLG